MLDDVTPDRSDDEEKTIQGDEREEGACVKRKDEEDGAPCEDREDEVRTREEVVDERLDEDVFPDGGLRAWSVVFGVSASVDIQPPILTTGYRLHSVILRRLDT